MVTPLPDPINPGKLMIEPKKLPELIRFARTHNYEQAEGFADEPWPMPDLPDEFDLRLREDAVQLADAAGVTEEVAFSAITNWALKMYLDRLT
jgi:hypothetical protein